MNSLLTTQLSTARRPSKDLWWKIFHAIHSGTFQKKVTDKNSDLWIQAEAFTRLIGAEAYLEAAMLLVPNGWKYQISYLFDSDGKGWWLVGLFDTFEENKDNKTPTPITHFSQSAGLAMIYAIVKARYLIKLKDK